MKILVTGAQGTLGRPLLRELRRRGHDTYGCDLRHSEDPKVVRADVSEMREMELLGDVFGNFDAVLHLAAEFGRANGRNYPEKLWRNNQIGTRSVIDLCVKSGARMILAGSSEAYGDHLTLPDGTLAEGLLDKGVGTFHNEYALSKWAQERQVLIATKNDGLKAVTLRFFNAYGPGEYYSDYRSVVCLFCYRLLFGLPITVYRNYHRVFMYVGIWCRTVANALERFDELPEKTYNVGGVEYRSVEEMLDIAIDIIKPENPEIKYLDKEVANVTNKRPDITLAMRDLDHSPGIQLEDGVRLTVDWMRRVYDSEGLLTQ